MKKLLCLLAFCAPASFLPGLLTHDVADVLAGDTVLICQFSFNSILRPVRFPDCSDLIPCKLVAWVQFSGRHPGSAFFGFVVPIINKRAQKEMGRIDASWIISTGAVMQDALSIRHQAVVKNPGQAMSKKP